MPSYQRGNHRNEIPKSRDCSPTRRVRLPGKVSNKVPLCYIESWSPSPVSSSRLHDSAFMWLHLQLSLDSSFFQEEVLEDKVPS